MPLPTRQEGESRKPFMLRCMADPTMLSEYPDERQRFAVCLTQSDAKESKGSAKERREERKDKKFVERVQEQIKDFFKDTTL